MKNTEFKPVNIRLKKDDLVSYPARAEGLVNMIHREISLWKLIKAMSEIKKEFM